MSKVMITVVVPIYNMEAYIDRCMSMLLNQTYPMYEILLVDDGSTDNSTQICEKYVQKYSNKVRYIHKKNGGLSSARNCGIDHARGQYIIFPDPDDWVELDYLERLAELRNIYPNALVCTGYIVEYESGGAIHTEKDTMQVFNQRKGLLRLIQTPAIGGFAWNKLYDIRIIQNNQMRFLDDVGTKEDLDFAARYVKHIDEVVYAPNYVTYHYFQRVGSATWSGYSQKRFDGLRVYEKMIAANPDDSELICAAKSSICSASLNLIAMYLKDGINQPYQWEVLGDNIRNNWKAVLFDSSCSVKRKLAVLAARINLHLVKFFYR